MHNTKSLMKPKDATLLENMLPEDVLHRYLYQPGEQHEDEKRRATDFIWSKNTYRLDLVLKESGNPVL